MYSSLNFPNADDSDNDLITDFLNSNCTETNTVSNTDKTNITIEENIKSNEQRPISHKVSYEDKYFCMRAPSVVLNYNMVPTIHVTPHSPVSKYNNIFEDTLCQLQSIRESVVQMKNATIHTQDYLPNNRLLNTVVLSASLPDLSGNNGDVLGTNTIVGSHYTTWLPHQKYILSTNRRKSWTADDDGTKLNCTNKSISLSSLDSEEHDTVQVSEQCRRSARNSTGGISTHSLNEIELARDFETIAAKRNLTSEIISRIPLQKSISTSSILAKDDIKTIVRHLTDSEDENQGLLRNHDKIEVFDSVEKRRKRGSLFFRKKKDKGKTKGQLSTVAACRTTTNMPSGKNHQFDCKEKKQKSFMNQKAITEKIETAQCFYDGSDQGTNNFSDDAPLIYADYINDQPKAAQDLGADPILGIALKEHDSWSPSVPREVLKCLTEKQIKRQEHIYEFIMTEKHHCQTLLVMQKVFVESLERHFPALNVNQMFPRLFELVDLHTAFLKNLRQKQGENYVVDSIADILLDFFSGEKAQNLRLAYGEFCANHRTALEEFKFCITGRDQSFGEWYKHCLANPLLKKKGIPECILFVTQRLTKYPLLIEPLLKSAGDEKNELDKLQYSLNLVKALLVNVDACVADKELEERQIEIFNRIDMKSFSIFKNKPFRKSDLGVASHRRLKFEGLATLMQGRSKMQMVLVVVLTDCLCFLNENSAHNKYAFFTPEHKAGVVPLQKLLIREKAGAESRGIYIISSNPAFPEMYELKVQKPKDKNVWIQSIRQAVLECPSSDVLHPKDITTGDTYNITVNKRELLEKMRQKDIELALLLEEKIFLQLSLLREQKDSESANFVSATNLLSIFASYKDLVNVDSDTNELWKCVLNFVQEITQLATLVYTAATGMPVSRSVSSVGEKQSETYASPTLPKRAETFAGFDERRNKTIFPWHDVTKLVTTQVMSSRLQNLEEKYDINNLQTTSVTLPVLQYANEPDPCVEGLDELSLKEHNHAALHVSHNLHTLLCIISQQMTTIHSLQLQLALYRESSKTVHMHNDQLEELRNLQDKLQEEKTAWLRLKEQQEQELEERHMQQKKLHEQIKAEQDDIKQQREQLYRKMELLSSQGLLLSPSTPLMVVNVPLNTSSIEDAHDGSDACTHSSIITDGANKLSIGAVHIRKERWRTASTISKTPPANLLSATNAPKINQKNFKQKIPIKLSSSSSSNTNKNDKSCSFTNSNNSGIFPLNVSSSSIAVSQMLPFKLADKSLNHAQQTVPQHSRTGSSPAIIQNFMSTTSLTSVSATRTDSVTTLSISNTTSSSKNLELPSSRNLSPLPFTATISSRTPKAKTEEQEIYF